MGFRILDTATESSQQTPDFPDLHHIRRSFRLGRSVQVATRYLRHPVFPALDYE